MNFDKVVIRALAVAGASCIIAICGVIVYACFHIIASGIEARVKTAPERAVPSSCARPIA